MRSANARTWGGIVPAGLLLFSVAAAGCGNSATPPGPNGGPLSQTGQAIQGTPGEVTLRAEAAAFRPGAPVKLVLDNGSGESVGYNLCFHSLERRVGGEWTPQPDGRACTAELRVLRAGDSADHDTELPSALGPGEYRFRVGVQLMDREEHRNVVTEVFQVE